MGQRLRIINNYRDYAAKCIHPCNMRKKVHFLRCTDTVANITEIHLLVDSSWRGMGRQEGVKPPPWNWTASFNFYFPLKLHFNVCITLFVQKININKINKKNKIVPLNLSANRYHWREVGSIPSPFSIDSDFIPEEIIIGRVMSIEGTQCWMSNNIQSSSLWAKCYY